MLAAPEYLRFSCVSDAMNIRKYPAEVTMATIELAKENFTDVVEELVGGCTWTRCAGSGPHVGRRAEGTAEQSAPAATICGSPR